MSNRLDLYGASHTSLIFLYVETSEQHDGFFLEETPMHRIWRVNRWTAFPGQPTIRFL